MMPWAYCPECGCAAVLYEEGEHKQCAECHQEWFSDIDYTGVVKQHLNELGKLRAKLDELESRLSRFVKEQATRFKRGDKVQKCGGDYTYEGEVVSVVVKRSGEIRYVVEDDRGMLFIFNGAAIRSQNDGE